MPKPFILVVNEHEEIELPEGLFAKDRQVDAFKEALERDYFSVRLKKGKLVFQAGGYVGMVPVNDSLMLDIRPKVPLGNLERVLLLSKRDLLQFGRGKRNYNSSKFSPTAVSDFLWLEFLNQAELVHELGLQKQYDSISGTLATPRGRVFPLASAIASYKSNLPQAACSWQQRSNDTAPNRLLKYLLHMLHKRVTNSADKGYKRRVAYCLSRYDSIPLDEGKTFLFDSEVMYPERISSTKDHYIAAIRIGKMILNGQGLGFIEGSPSGLEAASLLINMNDVFEDYVRNILIGSHALASGGIDVLDGNKGGAGGAKRNLLKRTNHPHQIGQDVMATPDVLLRQTGAEGKEANLVIDVKYKAISGLPDRSDLNQVISYACSYGSKCAVLVFPASSGNRGLQCLGAFQQTNVFQYFIDLANPEIEVEETAFAQSMSSLFQLDASD